MLLLSGLIISKFCHIYATQIAYCAVFGLTEGVYIGLTSVITIDIMGMETFVHAYGVQLFFMGAACVTGPPLIGECVIYHGKLRIDINHLLNRCISHRHGRL